MTKELAFKITGIVVFTLCLFSLFRDMQTLFNGVESVNVFYLYVDNIIHYLLFIALGVIGYLFYKKKN